MNLLLFLLLLSGFACGQAFIKPFNRDSLSGVGTSKAFLPDQMPVVRPNVSFYQNPHELPHVMRATTDNMPIKVSDSSMEYTMLQHLPDNLNPEKTRLSFVKPRLHIKPNRP